MTALLTLTVKSAAVSMDKLKVILEITGMKAGSVVYLKVGSVISASSAALWGTEAWYTQNAFGPGTPVSLAPAKPGHRVPGAAWIGIRRLGEGSLTVDGRLRIMGATK